MDEAAPPPPVLRSAPRRLWSGTGEQPGERLLPEETPVALAHDASTTAVMMATPSDLEDLAVGFTLTEGLVAEASQIRGVEIVTTELGVEARVWLAQGAGAALIERRRQIVGPTGCGLCGLDSLAQAVRPPARVGDELRLAPEDIRKALASLAPAQVLGAATRAVHAAGWWTPGEGLVAIREDVGRHNALDKLVGALARGGFGRKGVLLLTSRVSVEMVEKAAVLGAEILAAISVPTALAVRTAEAAGLTLIAVARDDSFEVFTHPHRLAPERAGVAERQEEVPSMDHAHLFAFEEDFVAHLRCIPMAVRFKLDQAGVKLTLRQWSRFSAEERRSLLLQPCEGDSEIAAYRWRLMQLVAERARERATLLPPGADVPWEQADATPEVVSAFADSLGVEPPSDEAWTRLTALQRFVLLKLSRANHDNVNFIPALREFGLYREVERTAAEVSPDARASSMV